jgi:hypothetical protein
MHTDEPPRKVPELASSALAATVELKDPAMRRENGIVFEVLDKRRDTINLDLNIIVKQEDKRMRGKLKTQIARLTKPKIPFVTRESQHQPVCLRFSMSNGLRPSAFILESLPAQPARGFIDAAIVDYDDLSWSV